MTCPIYASSTEATSALLNPVYVKDTAPDTPKRFRAKPEAEQEPEQEPEAKVQKATPKSEKTAAKSESTASAGKDA